MTLGENIRKFREEKGMTVQQLADAVCVNHAYISQIELYDRPFNTKLFFAIVRVLERNANDFCQ